MNMSNSPSISIKYLTCRVSHIDKDLGPPFPISLRITGDWQHFADNNFVHWNDISKQI
jgi:hypothetical protein